MGGKSMSTDHEFTHTVIDADGWPTCAFTRGHGHRFDVHHSHGESTVVGLPPDGMPSLCRYVDGQWVGPGPRPSDQHVLSRDRMSWVVLEVDTKVLEAAIRTERDKRLANSDWVVIRSSESGQEVPQKWIGYRDELRNITRQTGFPADVIWPDLP
jgi:hypothetical protein